MALDAGERQRKRGVLVCVDESRIRMQQAGGRLPHRPRARGGEPGIGVVTGQAAMKRGNQVVAFRSEERRVGKECVSTCRSRWSPDLYKKKSILTTRNYQPQ